MQARIYGGQGFFVFNRNGTVIRAFFLRFFFFSSSVNFNVKVVAFFNQFPLIGIVLYFFLTVAELFISPLGLSFVSKVAPKHMLGLCQGLWLGATALGNLLIWIGPVMYNAWPIWKCWTVFLVVCLISMGIMLGMVKWLERVTGE